MTAFSSFLAPTGLPVSAPHRPQTEFNAPAALLDYEPRPTDFRASVMAGLTASPRRLDCKFLYDDAGSHLFDRICELPEYYPTRTELRILRRFSSEIANAIGGQSLIVEYGSGSSTKTRTLLDALDRPVGYVPIDISRGHLLRAAASLAEAYPTMSVSPVCADYTQTFGLPPKPHGTKRTVAFFPGSTIGNFEPTDATSFLQSIRRQCGPGSGLLIGVDLIKDPATLHAAYNDSAGVTAAFNLNLLRRINRELAGTFDVDRGFVHHACFNPFARRMEMHLISLAKQMVEIGPDRIGFAEGDTIHTENCYKYTPAGFAALAARAGYRVDRFWTDERRWFSLQLLTADGPAPLDA